MLILVEKEDAHRFGFLRGGSILHATQLLGEWPQVGERLGDGLVSVTRVSFAGLHNEVSQRFGQVGKEFAGVLNVLTEPHGDHLVEIFLGVRAAAGDELIGGDAQGVNVGARIHGITLNLFRRRIVDGTRNAKILTPGRTGQPKIEYLDLVFRPHEDVIRLDVLMDDAPVMGIGEAVANLGQEIHRPGDGNFPQALQQVVEGLTFEILHDEETRSQELSETE